MRYIKLFEAFKSNKLSKTLKFVDTNSRRNFLDYLKGIGSSIDFPISEYSDDLFEYLPFQKALKKNVEIEDPKKIPCPYESEWIPGEFCTDGKVKRTWGSHIRTIECPRCGGKGYLEPKIKTEVGLLKFWFDKDGNFIRLTGTDGKNRSITSKWDIPTSQLSKSIDDYEVIDEIGWRKVKELKTGSVVEIQFYPSSEPVIAYVVQIPQWGNKRAYVFQDQRSGDSPNRSLSQDGYSFGRYSWVIGNSNDMYGKAKLLKPKGIEKVTVDNYGINSKVDFGYYGISLPPNSSVTNLDLKDAHFAIILDLKKLKQKEFKKKSIMQSDREEQKKGVLAFQSNEEIRKENFDRYLDKLIDTYDLDAGVKNIKRIIQIGLSNKPLYFITTDKNFYLIESMITNLYNIITVDEDYRKDSLKRDINYNIKRIYKETEGAKKIINASIDKLNKRFAEENKDDVNELTKMRKEMFDKWESINNKLFEKIKNFNTDSIAETEISWGKILTIRRFLQTNSDFLGLTNLRFLKNTAYYGMQGYDMYKQLFDIGDHNYKETLSELLEFEKLIDSI